MMKGVNDGGLLLHAGLIEEWSSVNVHAKEFTSSVLPGAWNRPANVD